jgi:growth arrest-specific protein 8
MAPKPKKNDPKGKNKGKAADAAAAAGADAVDDIGDPETKKAMRIEIRKLRDEINKQENFTGLYNDERLRINYFWLVAKKELEDKQAELRNKEREFQDLNEKHEITIKIYKQKLKHLVFQNLDKITALKKE